MNDERIAKVKISVNEGLIELEGPLDFVEKYIEEFKGKLSFVQNKTLASNESIHSAKIVKQKADLTQKKSVSKQSRSTGKNIEPEEFEIKSSEGSLEDFIASKNPGENSWNRIIVIGYYVTHKMNKPTFTEGNVEFAYKALGLSKRPLHLRQAFIDIKNKRKWLEELSEGGWVLSRLGEIYVEDQMPPKS